METLNEMKLSFLSRSSNEGFARVAVSSFLTQLDPTLDEVADIKTAVSEAVTNSIVHGYKDKIGVIYIHVKILSGNEIYIKISDRGSGIDDIKQAMEPLFTTCTTGERAGLGFVVMESFMDNIKVFSKIGKGTSVVLRKKLMSRTRYNG